MNKSFSIKAKTCTLKYNSQQQEDIILNSSKKYIVPIYQRPYSWSEAQIHKFISDIFISFHGYDASTTSEPMFIGTMQLSAPIKDNNSQEIIDGQQRLSTFLILLKILKEKYPENQELRSISFNWLETEVNNGEQNKFLLDFLEHDFSGLPENRHNSYFRNSQIISSLIDKETNSIEFDIDLFIKYVLTDVYFVVIETSAGLSKTLKIFDAINTTGLDLNGGDIFKIRMYEYLTTKKEYGKTAFNDINEIYGKIDRKNKEEDLSCNINTVLRIYQYVIISRYDLSNALFGFAENTFFDRLFDVIFNINQWDGFKSKNNEQIELSLDDLHRIVDTYYLWEGLKYPTAEDFCAMGFIWTSRYFRHSILVYLFIFNFQNDTDAIFEFNKKLSRLFIIYSIFFDKQIGNINTFIYNLLKRIFREKIDIDQLFHSLDNKIIGNVPYFDLKSQKVLTQKLQEELAGNHTRKYIISRLSAMLAENYKSNNQEEIKEIRKKLFGSNIDIEHIQSYNDNNEQEREIIKNQWGSHINSLGNLIILEQGINRSIKNKPYNVKIEHYKNSSFNIVRQQAAEYIHFDLNTCKTRGEMESSKIIDYIFEQKT